MNKKTITITVLLLLVIILIFSFLKTASIAFPHTYGHKLIGSKTFNDVSYTTTEVKGTLEANGWEYQGGLGKRIDYFKDGVYLYFTPRDETTFSINIIIGSKNEERARERFNQTLNELSQIFGWDMSGFDTHYSVESS